MSIGDDDITLEPGDGGEGEADGGANPEGHDGGADGSAGGPSRRVNAGPCRLSAIGTASIVATAVTPASARTRSST